MALTSTQRGILGQSEAAKLIVWGSEGEVEVAWPWTDDAHRDIEGHLRRGFASPIALQIKTTWRLWMHRHSEVIQIPFSLPKSRVLDDPRFWYLFGYMDSATMAYRPPLFLVLSADVHARAMPRLVDGRWRFTFQASLKPGAQDRWSPNRVDPLEVGLRVLAEMRALEKTPPSALWARLPGESGLLLTRKAA
ncbi:MAG: hypothetical protein ABI401_09135 [Candidatus Dormibacter sp.]